jgi:hypothetical protein
MSWICNVISREEFDALVAKGHTRIPLVREVFSDLDTPLSVYLKLADGPYTFLLESVEGGATWGRYSIIGLPAKRVYRLRGHELEVEDSGEVIERRHLDDPLAEIEKLRKQYDVPHLPGLPAFSGGLVGYFGFETIGYIEPRLAQWDRADELGTPDVLLMLAEEVAVFDNLKGRLYLIVHADPSQPQAYAAAERRLDALVFRLRQGGASYPQLTRSIGAGRKRFQILVHRDEFEAMVERAKEYIRAGDIFQVVPSQRLSVSFNARPVDVYRALRALNPSPYMYFFDLGETQIVGSSPEILARLKDGKVVVRPLAGTRARRDRRGRSGARSRTARRSERARRARHADRPRSQRHRSHQRNRQRGSQRIVRGRALLARHAHRVASARHRAPTSATWTCSRPRSPPARSAARRKSARWKSSRSWSRTSATSTPAPSAGSAGGATRTPPSPSAPPSSRTDVYTSRPAAASSTTPIPRPSGKRR